MDFIDAVLMSSALGSVAILVLVIGIRGLVTKKPFLISSRRLLPANLLILVFALRQAAAALDLSWSGTTKIISVLLLLPVSLCFFENW